MSGPKVKWKAVTGLHLSSWDVDAGFCVTFHSVDGKNFGVIVKEADLQGFADFFLKLRVKADVGSEQKP